MFATGCMYKSQGCITNLFFLVCILTGYLLLKTCISSSRLPNIRSRVAKDLSAMFVSLWIICTLLQHCSVVFLSPGCYCDFSAPFFFPILCPHCHCRLFNQFWHPMWSFSMTAQCCVWCDVIIDKLKWNHVGCHSPSGYTTMRTNEGGHTRNKKIKGRSSCHQRRNGTRTMQMFHEVRDEGSGITLAASNWLTFRPISKLGATDGAMKTLNSFQVSLIS